MERLYFLRKGRNLEKKLFRVFLKFILRQEQKEKMLERQSSFYFYQAEKRESSLLWKTTRCRSERNVGRVEQELSARGNEFTYCAAQTNEHC